MSQSGLEMCFVGVDVGTGSARAGVFDGVGRMRADYSLPIQIWRPEADFVEQSSENIWRAVCECVRIAIAGAGFSAQQVGGIGFDATCSLVALDEHDQPVSLSPTGHAAQNIIVWMDHRAQREADFINELNHDVLRYVGGRISPEMQAPKLLWLRTHLPGAWERAARFFDLPDFLTYCATGDETRSLCSVVCKWTYLGHARPAMPDSVGRWDDSFWRDIGLSELCARGYAKIGKRVRPMGEPLGRGLTENAARAMGLLPGTPVGVSIIDAHAGGLGVIGATLAGAPSLVEAPQRRIALIGGTSTCHMAVSPAPCFVPGVWGPYFSAMLPDLWLTEGGQSATGALIDHVIFSHASGVKLRTQADAEHRTVYEILNERLASLASGRALPAELTRHLHVQPDFHGNRSPRADASLRGMVSGLTLGDTLDDLALLYLATIQALAYGTRHILETLNAGGYAIDTILACGGGTKNPIFLREHADATGCRVVLPREPEAVLLGAAILGAVAGGAFSSIPEAQAALTAVGEIIKPSGAESATYHARKYAVFHQMHTDFAKYRREMQSPSG